MKKRSDLLLLLPSLCGFTVFYIVPFLYSLYYAFTENAFSDKFVGLANFKMLLENGEKASKSSKKEAKNKQKEAKKSKKDEGKDKEISEAEARRYALA